MAGPNRAAGHPSYDSGGASPFIPEVWAGKMVTKFYATTVFGDISSNDYEGLISNLGDKVKIRTRPTIAINDYTIGGGLTYEKPTAPAVELQIDNAKSFAFELNDVDAYQSDQKLMDEFTDDASEQMQIVIDQDVLGSIFVDVAPVNAGGVAGKASGSIDLGAAGAPKALTRDNVIDWIVDMGIVLDEQNVPQTGRWLVLPPWICGLIKTSDLKDASLAGDQTSIVRNGKTGMIDRFTIYNSNNLNMSADSEAGGAKVTDVVAGHPAGLTWASQMTKMGHIDNPNDFGQLVRGLNVYGYKVIEGNYLAHSRVARG